MKKDGPWIATRTVTSHVPFSTFRLTNILFWFYWHFFKILLKKKNKIFLFFYPYWSRSVLYLLLRPLDWASFLRSKYPEPRVWLVGCAFNTNFFCYKNGSILLFYPFSLSLFQPGYSFGAWPSSHTLPWAMSNWGILLGSADISPRLLRSARRWDRLRPAPSNLFILSWDKWMGRFQNFPSPYSLSETAICLH
jgi:hypothetical protein